MGKFISVVENYKEGYNMDVARFLIRVPMCFRLVERISVSIGGDSF